MKIIFRSTFIFVIFFIFFIAYLSLVGIKTDRFNDQVKNKLNTINKYLDIELNEISIKLNPIKLKIQAKTLGSRIISNNQVLEIESIKSDISLISLLKDKFIIQKLVISTKSIEIKNLVSFSKNFYNNPKFSILEKLVKTKGFLIANLNIEFDENGNVKDNYSVKGYVNNTQLNFLDDFEIDKLNFVFNIEKNEFKLEDIKFSLNEIDFVSKKIDIKKNDEEYFIKGVLSNSIVELSSRNLKLLNLFSNLKLNKIRFRSSNKFSFNLGKSLKIKKKYLQSNLQFEEIRLPNNFNLKNIFPEINDEILIKNNDVKIKLEKNNWEIDGNGKILLQKNEDSITYEIMTKDQLIRFNGSVEIGKNPFIINLLNFQKNQNAITKISFKGLKDLKDRWFLENIKLVESENKIIAKNINLNNDLKIRYLDFIQADYLDGQGQKNILNLSRDKKIYTLSGDIFNADRLIENILMSDEEKFFSNDNFELILDIDKVRLDNEFNLKNLSGNLKFKKQKVLEANLTGHFSSQKKIKFTIKTIDNESITTFFIDYAKPIVKRYKFIKGFDGGVLDFYSTKKGDISNSTLKIYDFNLKELPTLTKLLTLASLQGIADILSGEGIRFDEFEMNFQKQNKLMTIEEVYAIGPAISILMDGYVEKDKLISLRGTLVPATTINKVIGSIPVVGKILVGKKTGEGVFGVSFKIKGPPKKLETTVNPIKTLTPRFITRTLEKIKKN